MNPLRSTEKEPLWREEVSIFAADERYVNRRQFAKFLMLTSAGMFVGNLWILIRPSENEFLAYSQKCTHLSCAVYYAPRKEQFECPCHLGYFSAKDGRVLAGPPQRPLPRILLQRQGDRLIAVGVDLQTERI
jgi:Rieske Fe-S protein